MKIYDFDWDEINLEHIAEHDVEDYEVEEVILFNKPIYRKGRKNNYLAYGVTEEGRYLFIVFSTKGHGLIRIITARDMDKKERKYYKKRR